MDFYALRGALLKGELWADNPPHLPLKFKGGVWIFSDFPLSKFVQRVMINDFIPDERGFTLLAFHFDGKGFLASLWPPGPESAEYVIPLITLGEIEHGELVRDRMLKRIILTQTKRRRPDIMESY